MPKCMVKVTNVMIPFKKNTIPKWQNFLKMETNIFWITVKSTYMYWYYLLCLYFLYNENLKMISLKELFCFSLALTRIIFKLDKCNG